MIEQSCYVGGWPLSSFLLRNPITQAELTHLKRSKLPTPTWLDWVMCVLSASVILAAIVTITWEWVSFPRTPDQDLYFYPQRFTLTLILSAITIVLHFVVLVRILSVSANSIQREKAAGTWENLLLTGISARHLILGKWWAALRATWKDFALLALVRAGVSVGLGTVVYGTYLNRCCQWNGPYTYALSPELIARDTLLAVVAISLFTLMNALFTAAAGVAGSIISGQTRFGLMSAVMLRISLIVGVIIFLLPCLLLVDSTPTRIILPMAHPITGFYKPLLMLFWALVDNGTIAAAGLANSYETDGEIYLAVTIAALAIYALLTVVLLVIAQVVARRQGVSDTAS
ncbi:MAG: hypothetical protein H7Y09_00990 [Chitinophagaceae bacterium]|nr:hypothetical protein [Anaerolineae bacterium]